MTNSVGMSGAEPQNRKGPPNAEPVTLYNHAGSGKRERNPPQIVNVSQLKNHRKPFV